MGVHLFDLKNNFLIAEAKFKSQKVSEVTLSFKNMSKMVSENISLLDSLCTRQAVG